ncbi:Heavy metal-associated isoprenylated plant protein [Actinidia chinensis var. chinensis]|uniref:Heavy metal-associated isoprenylated plant protein n=1 Tax=Actinidia chinensis var. chinensis TaxID=1590841 RepID=A0A2R6Q1Q9_ACTCC|nr:Heavy metal-associated isoprenylated plant protein [Actinidia chinensis var. chinensis]
MLQKIELKVNINCQKCSTEILKAVTKLRGINEVSVNGEKGTLTVVGDVDPVLVTKKVRKIGKIAQITSVGPPKKKETERLPPHCNDCQFVAVSFPPYDSQFCSIL